MKILVLGGCGFIGSHVVDALLRDGHEIRIFDRNEESFRLALPSVEYRLGDFTDQAAVRDAVEGMEAVFHLVSTTFPSTAALDPKRDVRENLLGTQQLVEAMLDANVSRLLFLSSGGTVYGITETVPIDETHPLRPINSYGITKVAIESYLEMYRRTRGLSPIIIRASNPFGPRQGHTGVQGVVATFLNQIVNGAAVEVWGDGSVVRDYVFVRDLARFCALAGASGKEGVYNAGSGRGTSLVELLAAMEDVTGRAFERRFKPAPATDVPVSVLDCSAALETFNWSAETDMLTGLQETWDWIMGLNLGSKN